MGSCSIRTFTCCPIWTPAAERVAASNLTQFAQFVRREHGAPPGDYRELWRWSVDARERFWPALMHFAGLVRDDGSARVEVESVLPGEAEKKALPQAGNVYIQVGAFSSRGNAEDLRTRLASELPGEPLNVVSISDLWRLHVGPYVSQEAARAVAQRIESQLNLKGFLVVR